MSWLWHRFIVSWGCRLLYPIYRYRVEIVDSESHAVIALILCQDMETYQRNFNVGPRYHTERQELTH